MSTKPSLGWKDAALLSLVAAVLLFPSLGATPFIRAEIYFADAARAMVEQNDWLVPHFRGAPFFDKPALSYWLFALSFELFGFSISAARFVPALTAILVILATLWLGSFLWHDRSALAAGWILAATAAFMSFGRLAMSDMLLTLWTTLGIALAVACYQTRRPSLALVGLGAALGLGFFTKGPIAPLVILPGCAYLLWTHRKQRPAVSAPAIALALAVFAVLAFGWFAAVYLRLGAAPLDHFFLRENLQRFGANTYDSGRGLSFYLVTYLGQGAPWSLFLPFAAVSFFRTRPDTGGRLLIVWLVCVGALLTASRGKVDYYLLPLYPAAALAAGRYLTTASWGRTARAGARAVLLLFGLLACALPPLLLQVPAEWRPTGVFLAGVSLVMFAAGILAFRAAIHPTPQTTLTALAGVACVLFGVANIVVLPAYYAGQPNHAVIREFLRERAEQPDVSVALREDPLQIHRDLLFDQRLEVVNTGTADRLWQLAESETPHLLLVTGEEAETLLKSLPAARRLGDYRYLPYRVFTLRGVLSKTEPERIVLLANYSR